MDKRILHHKLHAKMKAVVVRYFTVFSVNKGEKQ